MMPEMLRDTETVMPYGGNATRCNANSDPEQEGSVDE